MDQTLGFLREILSNYTEGQKAHSIYAKLEHSWVSAEEFINHLQQEEIHYLNKILPDEIDYAKNEQDDLRVTQLTNVFELLY